MRDLSDRVSSLRISPIRRVAGLLDEARLRTNIISFGGGSPSVAPPKEVLEEICSFLRKEPLRSSAYAGTKGIPELRQKISEDIKKFGDLEYDSENEIIITIGNTEAIYSVLMSILNTGDEVIVLDPTYLGYCGAIELAGGRLRTLPATVEARYQPDLEKLKCLITDKTKAFLLLSPDNPTGRVISKTFVKGLIDLANDHNFWILSDDTYKHILYEGEHVWVAGFREARERTIMLCSFSKEASVPGLRLGYALGPSHIVDGMEKIKQYTSLAPSALSQYAMVKFLTGDVKTRYLRHIVIPTYKKRMEYMGECIHRYLSEARTVHPAGAFYYFVDMSTYMSKMQTNDDIFSQRLLKRKNVVAIPGSFFGRGGEQHVRMTFVSEPEERIDIGVKAISEFVEAT